MVLAPTFSPILPDLGTRPTSEPAIDQQDFKRRRLSSNLPILLD
ncbi:hypothetical protein C4K39_0855 [Pseudomonas sessilinigenes]|nr:hypothetical protein C4K39_0855 [Pseudomonas sessilinigenes]